jgi:hypothetical protein
VRMLSRLCSKCWHKTGDMYMTDPEDFYEYTTLGPMTPAEADAIGWCPDEPAWADADRLVYEPDSDELDSAGMEALGIA